MTRKLLLLLGALALGAGATLFFLREDRAPSRSPSTTEPSPSTIPALLPQLSAFVERARGLQFREDVKVTVLSQSLFEEQLKEAAPDPEQIARAEAVLKIVGLLQPEGDLLALLAASDRRTAGFYSSAGKELVIREELTPLARRVLVHELTHALDDQHFGIERDIEGEEAAAAFQSLIEGSAIRVEQLYVESLPQQEQEQIEAAEQQIRAEVQLPPAVEQLLGFPYVFGPTFVDALLNEGPERLNQAFAAPPVTTEQVLDPARYLSGDTPQPVRPPRTEGPVLDEGEFGPVLLRLILESKLEHAVADEASTGWDGDRYATWRAPDGRTCIRVQFAVDTPEDRGQLEAALAAWVNQTTDREVDSAGLLLKACSRP